MAEKLIEITRGDVVECIHRGDISIVNSKGQLAYKVGNPDKYTYFRSAAKPIQALNVILSGAADKFNFSSKELAVMCASHYAEKNHIDTVQKILEKIDLTKDYILSGKSKPLNSRIAFKYAWENREDDQLFNDCSGKHAGMLAICKYKGYLTENYNSKDHPIQKEILEILSDISHYDSVHIKLGIDGCSVPVHALPLYNMALAYARLADTDHLDTQLKTAADRIFRAMVENPFMIAGTNGFCTELIKQSNGKLIGKIGAEGVYCLGIKDKGLGIAVKIEDGSMDVLPPVVIKILEELEVLNKNELKSLEQFRILNNYNDVNNVVGTIYPAFNLKHAK